MDHIHRDSATCNMEVQGKSVIFGGSVLSGMEHQCVKTGAGLSRWWDQMQKSF